MVTLGTDTIAVTSQGPEAEGLGSVIHIGVLAGGATLAVETGRALPYYSF